LPNFPEGTFTPDGTVTPYYRVVFRNTDKGGRGFYRWMDRDVEVEIVIRFWEIKIISALSDLENGEL